MIETEVVVCEYKDINILIDKIRNSLKENKSVYNQKFFFLEMELLDSMEKYRDALLNMCAYIGINPVTGIRF